jgi:iron(III) transport system substrate-binding protein
VLRNPVEAGTLRTFIGAMVQRAIASGGSEDDGFKLLEGIARNVESYPASPDLMFEALEKGPRASVTIWGLTDLVFQRQQKGYTFRAAGLDEPVPVLIDAIALVRGAGDDADARAFYEFVNTPEATASLARKHCRIPARPDFDRALLNEEIRSVPWIPMALDFAQLAQKIPAWLTRFETISRSVR